MSRRRRLADTSGAEPDIKRRQLIAAACNFISAAVERYHMFDSGGRAMSNKPPQLRVDGLTSLQLAELQATVATAGSDYVTTLGSPGLGGGTVGEPTLLTAVITLGPYVISAVALWLSKQKKRGTRSFKYTKIDPNGTMQSIALDEFLYAEGEAKPAAI